MPTPAFRSPLVGLVDQDTIPLRKVAGIRVSREADRCTVPACLLSATRGRVQEGHAHLQRQLRLEAVCGLDHDAEGGSTAPT